MNREETQAEWDRILIEGAFSFKYMRAVGLEFRLVMENFDKKWLEWFFNLNLKRAPKYLEHFKGQSTAFIGFRSTKMIEAIMSENTKPADIIECIDSFRWIVPKVDRHRRRLTVEQAERCGANQIFVQARKLA